MARSPGPIAKKKLIRHKFAGGLGRPMTTPRSSRFPGPLDAIRSAYSGGWGVRNIWIGTGAGNSGTGASIPAPGPEISRARKRFPGTFLAPGTWGRNSGAWHVPDTRLPAPAPWRPSGTRRRNPRYRAPGGRQMDIIGQGEARIANYPN